MRTFLRSLFGCAHERTTFPLTLPGRPTYVVCLGCGREFAYDWQKMTIGERLDPPPQQEAA